MLAHGARDRPGAAAAHARTIARRGLFAEVRACCLKSAPGLSETLAGLRASTVYLVPLLMAEGYLAHVAVPRALAVTNDSRLIVCRPLGTSPGLGHLIAERAAAVCRDRGWRRRESAVLLVAHGTPRDAGSTATARRHVARIAADGAFARVALACLDEPPSIADAVAGLDDIPNRVAVGLFADHGVHGEDDVRRHLAAADGRVAYAGPIGSDPHLADLIVEQVRTAARNPATA